MQRRAGPAGLAAATAVGSLVFGLSPSAAAPVPETTTGLLHGFGCFIGEPADSGVRFEAAVLRFQSANDLRQTGGANERTRARLSSPDGRRCDVRAVPADSGSGRRVVVSQRQNWVWLVREDGSVAGQGGIVDNDWLSPGSYHTGAQCGRPARSRYRSSEDGTLSIDYFVRFADCSVGFHQIPVQKRTERQIHPDFYVGTDLRESHGCLRVPHPLVKKLWRFTEERTKVVIVAG